MLIVTLVKHVPDEASEPRIEDGVLVRGEDDVLNELDEHAIEAALQLKEEFGGEVIALSMGPEDAEDGVLRAMQIGADSGLVVSDDALAGSDIPKTARTLALAVKALGKDEPVDLVLAGMASFDGSASAVPAGVAQALGWPLLDVVSELEVEVADDGFVAEGTRKVDGFEDTLRASGPLVVSVTDQINEPRYPSFKDLRAARSKPLDVWDLEQLSEEAGVEQAGLDQPASLRMLSADHSPRTAGTIVADSGEGGNELAERLIELGVVAK